MHPRSELLVQTWWANGNRKHKQNGKIGFSVAPDKSFTTRKSSTKNDEDFRHGSAKNARNGEDVFAKHTIKNINHEKNETYKNKIKKPNKFIQALDLPVIANLNPRSVYNKVEEFHEFVKEESVDLLYLSE